MDRYTTPNSPSSYNILERDPSSSLYAFASSIDGSYAGGDENIPEEVDLRALTYLSPIDDNLNCPICQCPFVRPIMTTCDHIFCEYCLGTALKTSLTCPVDRRDLHIEGSVADISHEPTAMLLRGLRRGGSLMDVPNAISNMVDDLRVKCPYSSVGCKVESARCNVQKHVDKDCGYVKVLCLSESCGLKVLRKDLGTRCLHGILLCDGCGMEMVEADLKTHRATCPKLSAICPHCSAKVLRGDLFNHVSECPEATIACTGASLGCSYCSKRKLMQAHSSNCPFVLFGPFLKGQNDRMRAIEDENKLLKRKLDLVHPPDGLATQDCGDPDLPYTPPSLPTILNFPDISPLDLQGMSQPDGPPFSSPTHHLLSLHESLRSEVDQLAANILDLEVKQSMMLMNESLRTNEELAGIRAAIAAIRMQVHWLMSQRLQTGPQARPNVVGGSSRSGPSGGGSGPSASAPQRRLSDTRQDVKL